MTNEELKKYDFILLLDKSGSMATPDCANGTTRWAAAKEATIALARKCAEFDSDGITVIPFAGSFKAYDNITDGPDQVNKIFSENEPNGSTDTAKVIKHVTDAYFSRKKAGNAKPIIVLVITDGTPDSKSALAQVIVDATKQIDKDEEIGISFIQVGKDPGASEFLKMLDDDLVKQGAKFDIVDTKTMDEVGEMPLADVLVAALTD
ncbi:hypothetical protein BH11BAC1_BH11BAC1_28050 [soil metagenome]